MEKALALYKVVFLVFVCIAGFVALAGVSVDDERAGELYGKNNLHGAFRQRTKTTPYGYAKSLLSILYAFRGWYALVPRSFGKLLMKNLGKMQIMSGCRCPIRS